MTASVKIMLSYDYNHFEVTLSDECKSLQAVNELRKSAQRLADEAIRQYKAAKAMEIKRLSAECDKADHLDQIRRIQSKSEGELTLNEMAILKAFKDHEWEAQFDFPYDYDDDDPEQWF